MHPDDAPRTDARPVARPVGRWVRPVLAVLLLERRAERVGLRVSPRSVKIEPIWIEGTDVMLARFGRRGRKP